MSIRSASVVVAVDGSHESVRALRWAGYEAARRRAELVAVHAYRPADDPAAAASARAEATLRLDRSLRTAFGHRPPVPVRSVVDSRPPVAALLARCQDAALLVLTARPDPHRPGVVHGTAVEHCVHAAACPVVVLLAHTADGSDLGSHVDGSMPIAASRRPVAVAAPRIRRPAQSAVHLTSPARYPG